MLSLFSVFLALLPAPALVSAPLVLPYGYAVMREEEFTVAAEAVMATTQQSPSPVQNPRLSKTLDSLVYVDQWPQQQMFKQLPDSADRDLEKVEIANFARHQPLLEKIVR